MPFDYNSFLQGVQTGLRLGRTSPGRQPPLPSGKYILTESGEKVLSEKTIDWGDTTIYGMGSYAATAYDSQLPSANIVLTGLDMTVYSVDASGNGTRFFYFENTSFGYPYSIQVVIFWTDPNLDSNLYEITYGTSVVRTGAGGRPYEAGEYRYVITDFYYFWNGGYNVGYLRIDGASCFHGSEYDLTLLFADTKNFPMITEGG